MLEKNNDTKPFALAIAGMTGVGKSTYVNALVRKYSKQGYTPYIFDINKEPMYIGLPYRIFDGDIDKFTIEAGFKLRSVLVFEEATIFFTNPKRAEKLLKILVQKRHKNNIIIFVFHSLRALPIVIRDMINYLLLFKTSDNQTLINSKFKDDSDVLELFNDVQNEANYFYKQLLELNPVDKETQLNLFKTL